MLNNLRVIFINMKNFPILDENGKEWWISRSIAVTGCIFTFLNGKWCVLANKRGEAVIREVYEETGVKVNPDYLHFWCFNDSPTQNRQNVSFRYYALVDAQPGNISVGTGNDRGSEIQEWLDKQTEPYRYIILDDDSDMLDCQLPYFIQTDWLKWGLSDEDVEQAIHILNDTAA